ncbi:hypothetical protein BC831DRAFT_404397 [Entophlyctis helioformis]|nr:hypothetical protein BC831DRAFT_404397 [Entophlyctis helioformis]
MAAADPSERIKFLIKTMAALDPNDELRHWILDHPMELDEDADDNVPESLAGRRVNGSRAAFCRVMAQVAFALGSTLASEGNPRHGYHMMTCAVTIYEIIARAAQRTRQDKLSDTHAYLVFYREIAQIASLAGDADHAVLYATKLVALHDVAVAESLNDDSSAMRSSSPTTPQIDLASRLSAQLLLADVAVKGLHFGTAVHAYTRALQLFDLQESLLLELADTNDEMTDFKRQRQATRKDICLRLVDANEDAKGDALISLTYARRACEISTSSPGSDSGVSTNEDDVRLVFRTGVLVYKYVLQIAGGIDHASSPPVAAILDATVTAAGQKGPSIRTLLEEAVQLLEDARSDATADVSDPNSKRAIGLQLAILFTEIRDEDKARELLREYSFNNSNLQDLDQHRRRSRSHQPGEGYSPSMIAPFANVVYSPEAFKRLVSIAPVYEAKGSLPSAARLTLSRGRRSTFLGASPVATKVPCAYCSMIFTSDDPLKCEDCAAQRVFVYYCCDECMSQHQPQHEPDCAKTRPLSAAQDFTLTATLSSLLSN